MRRPLFVAALAALAIAAVAGAILRPAAPTSAVAERPAAERPQLLVLTSLPIVFPEKFTLDSGSSPVLQALRRRYEVVPISVADAASLQGHELLLMAQPRAQPAEALVELDAWVRGGGRVLLLADPALHWPSQRPLGDPLRPPLAFADTGLLAHWGLKLDGTGGLIATAPDCKAKEGLIAHCALGRGRATVIADADFLGGDDSSAGVALLLAQLGELER